MATSKKAAPAPTPEPLVFKIKVPGSNATISFWKPSELTPRQSRELNSLQTYLFPKLRAVAQAQEVVDEEGETLDASEILTGGKVQLSRQDVKDLFEFNDLAGFTYLKSWTIQRDGEVRPLPKSATAMQDLPQALYDLIVEHAGKIVRSTDGDEFSVDAIEDEGSPTEV